MTFYCQECRSPLHLHESLRDLNPAAIDLLIGPEKTPSDLEIRSNRPQYPPERLSLYEQAFRDATQQNAAKSPTEGLPAPDMSFIMLTESHIALPGQNQPQSSSKQPSAPSLPPSDSLSSKIDSSEALFEIISARSEISHPLCSECTELTLESLQERFDSTVRERDFFVDQLKQLKQSEATPSDITALQAELENAHLAEQTAMAELLSLESAKEDLDKEAIALRSEILALEKEEEAFYAERNAYLSGISELETQLSTLNKRLTLDEGVLDRLRRTNIYNDTFSISHDGLFGTINGLRLGRLSAPNTVEWAEINAAWGTTLLMIDTIARRLNYTFKGYVLKPLGSAGTIEKLESSQSQSPAQSRTNIANTSRVRDPASPSPSTSSQTPRKAQRSTTLELFSSGDIPLIGTLLHRKFNDAISALLACLHQLMEYVQYERGSPAPASPRTLPSMQAHVRASMTFPYQVDVSKDTVHGKSIRIGVGSDEDWTSACKYLLTNCKLLLAQASAVGK